MTLDPIRACRELEDRKRGHLCAFVLAAVLAVMTYFISVHEIISYENVDFHVHAHIAASFDFSDLHTITSRLAYPLWHLIVSAIYQLGVPLEMSAAMVSSLCKAGTYLLVYVLALSMSGGSIKRWICALVSFALLILTPIRVAEVNPFIYRGVGSPNVWHNPTQQAVTLAMMMVMPWLAHCWYEFERQLNEGVKTPVLPWWKVIVLAVLGMGSLACKPTFMQALLPAAFVMYAVEVFRRPRQWRYFGQIVLAFVPSAAYFLLQYLYYTGVVVEFTSGVTVGITWMSFDEAVRNAVLMSACPLAAVIVCMRRGLFKDRSIVLALLMVAFSALEAMAFRETGMREGHGNFTWAANSSSFFLWAVMAGVFLREMVSHVRRGTFTAARKLGAAAVAGLFVWHVWTGVSYYVMLMTTDNIF